MKIVILERERISLPHVINPYLRNPAHASTESLNEVVTRGVLPKSSVSEPVEMDLLLTLNVFVEEDSALVSIWTLSARSPYKDVAYRSLVEEGVIISPDSSVHIMNKFRFLSSLPFDEDNESFQTGFGDLAEQLTYFIEESCLSLGRKGRMTIGLTIPAAVIGPRKGERRASFSTGAYRWALNSVESPTSMPKIRPPFEPVLVRIA